MDKSTKSFPRTPASVREYVKDSKVYYAVLNNGSNGSENSILNPMKEVVSIMELLKQEYQEIDDVTICDVIIDILDDVYT